MSARAGMLESASLADAARGIAADLEQVFGRVVPVAMRGRVSKAVGMVIEATGIQAHVGELCELVTPGEPPLLAEVVGFQQHTAILTPLGATSGLSALTEVVPTGRGHACPVGPALLGRVLDALGRPLDGRGPLGPPLTGASSTSMPFSAKRAWRRRIRVGEFVERSNQTEPGARFSRRPPGPSATASTSFGPGNEVRTISLWAATSAGVSAHSQPASMWRAAAS